MRTTVARFLALGLTAVILLVVAPPALAVLTVSDVVVTPSTTAAGAHPDLTIATTFAGENTLGPGGVVSDSPRSLSLHLGPGIIGNPLAAPTCPVATFEANGCPANTIVGSGSLSFVVVANGAPVTLPSVVYNVATDSPAQAAQLGVQTLAPNPAPPPVLVPISALRVPVTISPVDLGLDSTTAEDLTASTASTGPIRITAISITLNGTAASGFYMTNPTSCIPVAVSATATSWGGATDSDTASYTPTDCATEPFAASLSTSLDTTATDSPAQVSVTVSTPADETPRRNAHVLASTVVLPEGMTINSALGEGLEACTDAQFAVANRAVAAACPAASRIGTVTFRSPLFTQAFEGPVYFGTPTPTAANRLFVDVPVPGVHIKLLGRTLLDETTGRITTIFEDLPQIPFTDFTLTFRGGPHSVLVTPQTCGPHEVSAALVPYTRLTSPTPPNATPTATFTTSGDGAGAPCTPTFRPFFTASLSNAQAGDTGTFTLRFARFDRDARFARAAFRLPAGLVGDLSMRGLTRCSLTAAAAGSCPASSRVGHVSVEVGVGPDPATLPGELFLTAPRAQGDPAGLSILVPAQLGPVDLGDIIVGVRLRLRSNGGLNVTSEPLPQIQGGVPLAIRSVTLALDRAGFMRNPTSCGRKRFSGVFDAVGGASVTTHAAVTITGCDRLPFGPRIRGILGSRGRTGAGSHPPFTTIVTQRRGEAAIRRAHVRLPLALATNLTAINAACSPEDLAARACSKRARVARAVARSPLIAGPVRGPVYLVTTEPGRLPKLVVQLRRPLAIDFEGFVRVGRRGAIATTFPLVPDLSITRFSLKFHGGRFGVLAATRDLCAKRLRLPTSFRGHNGKTVKRRPVLRVRGC